MMEVFRGLRGGDYDQYYSTNAQYRTERGEDEFIEGQVSRTCLLISKISHEIGRAHV